MAPPLTSWPEPETAKGDEPGFTVTPIEPVAPGVSETVVAAEVAMAALNELRVLSSRIVPAFSVKPGA